MFKFLFLILNFIVVYSALAAFDPGQVDSTSTTPPLVNVGPQNQPLIIWSTKGMQFGQTVSYPSDSTGTPILCPRNTCAGVYCTNAAIPPNRSWLFEINPQTSANAPNPPQPFFLKWEGGGTSCSYYVDQSFTYRYYDNESGQEVVYIDCYVYCRLIDTTTTTWCPGLICPESCTNPSCISSWTSCSTSSQNSQCSKYVYGYVPPTT